MEAEIIRSFDSWTVPKKNSLCCLLGAYYAKLFSWGRPCKKTSDENPQLNLVTVILQNAKEQFRDKKTPITYDAQLLKNALDGAGNDMNALSYTSPQDFMIISLPLAFILRNQDPMDIRNCFEEIMNKLGAKGDDAELAYVYLTIIKAILDGVPADIINETVLKKFTETEFPREKMTEISQKYKELNNAGKGTPVDLDLDEPCINVIFLVMLLLRMISGLEYGESWMSCAKQQCPQHDYRNDKCKTKFKCSACGLERTCGEDHKNISVNLNLKSGSQIIKKVTMVFRKDHHREAPYWLYDTVFELTSAFDDETRFYSFILGSVIGAFMDSLGKIDDQSLPLFSMDAQFITLVPESRINCILNNKKYSSLITLFEELYDMTALNQITAQTETKNEDDIIDCRGFPSIDERHFDHHEIQFLCFKEAFLQFMDRGIFPNVFKFACIQAMKLCSNFSRIPDVSNKIIGKKLLFQGEFFHQSLPMRAMAVEGMKNKNPRRTYYFRVTAGSWQGEEDTEIKKYIDQAKEGPRETPYQFIFTMRKVCEDKQRKVFSFNHGILGRSIYENVVQFLAELRFGKNVDKLLYERAFSLGVLFRVRFLGFTLSNARSFDGNYNPGQFFCYSPLDNVVVKGPSVEQKKRLSYVLGEWPRNFILSGDYWTTAQAQSIGQRCSDLKRAYNVMKKLKNEDPASTIVACQKFEKLCEGSADKLALCTKTYDLSRLIPEKQKIAKDRYDQMEQNIAESEQDYAAEKAIEFSREDMEKLLNDIDLAAQQTVNQTNSYKVAKCVDGIMKNLMEKGTVPDPLVNQNVANILRFYCLHFEQLPSALKKRKQFHEFEDRMTQNQKEASSKEIDNDLQSLDKILESDFSGQIISILGGKSEKDQHEWIKKTREALRQISCFNWNENVLANINNIYISSSLDVSPGGSGYIKPVITYCGAVMSLVVIVWIMSQIFR